jgi:hypothetical protein
MSLFWTAIKKMLQSIRESNTNGACIRRKVRWHQSIQQGAMWDLAMYNQLKNHFSKIGTHTFIFFFLFFGKRIYSTRVLFHYIIIWLFFLQESNADLNLIYELHLEQWPF